MILFVDQSGQPGGAELCLADIAAHYGQRAKVLLFANGPFADLLRQRGIAVDVLPLSEAAGGISKKASLSRIASGIPELLRHVLGIRRKFSGCELVYLNTAKALVEGTLANIPRKVPIIFHLHDLWNESHFKPGGIRMLIAAANRAQAVIANSQITADTFVAAGGNRNLITVIANGFDPVMYDPSSGGNPGDRPVAAIFGRISRWKGQEILIRAAALVPELVVWIVGDALFTADDRAYAEELRRLVAAENLSDRVCFLGFRDDVPALMREADMVVHCSIAEEPFGRVLVEAMLAQRPVIASCAGGPLEIIEDGGTGILFSPGDHVALAEAIRGLIMAPETGRKMGRLGRERAERLYSLSTTLALTDKVISSVLERHRS